MAKRKFNTEKIIEDNFEEGKNAIPADRSIVTETKL